VSQYITPPDLTSKLKGMIDPNQGFLCMSSHWRPDPGAEDPEMPGHKLSMSSYIPAFSYEACLCGSGQQFGDCCRPKRQWHPICPNPGMEGYSLTKSQSATFRNIDGAAVRERLVADPRLRGTEADPARAFWVFHGDPVIEDRYGILCLGDLELKDSRILVVSAMSDLRMQALLAVLQEIAGEFLGHPHIRQDPTYVMDKQTGKMKRFKSPAPQSPRRKSRRKRRRR
jgi:hypothetical protein